MSVKESAFMQYLKGVQDIQSYTKVHWIVLQYLYFSVSSRFPLKRVCLSRNFLAVLPPPTLYKVETLKEF